MIKGLGTTNFLKDVKVEYSGYEKRGSANITSDSELAVFKKVAKYEGKKAKVDSRTMNAIIKNADSVSDLTDEGNFNSSSMSSEEVMNAENYLDHMEETKLYLSKSEDLKNGQKN